MTGDHAADHVRAGPRRLPPLAGGRRRAGRHRDHAGDARRRPAPRLRAQAQQLRPLGRHRAVRHHAAPPVRAPRGQGGRRHRRARQGLLRGRQHPDAGDVDARPQGGLLQVHQRDPQRHRGRHRALGPDLDRGGQRHRGRRRLRAGARLRRDRAGRRPVLVGVAARGAAARGPARHRRPHPGGRQAQGAPRPGRRVLHPQPRGRRAARPSSGDWSTPSPPAAASTRWSESGPWPGPPHPTARTTPRACASTPCTPNPPPTPWPTTT